MWQISPSRFPRAWRVASSLAPRRLSARLAKRDSSSRAAKSNRLGQLALPTPSEDSSPAPLRSTSDLSEKCHSRTEGSEIARTPRLAVYIPHTRPARRSRPSCHSPGDTMIDKQSQVPKSAPGTDEACLQFSSPVFEIDAVAGGTEGCHRPSSNDLFHHHPEQHVDQAMRFPRCRKHTGGVSRGNSSAAPAGRAEGQCSRSVNAKTDAPTAMTPQPTWGRVLTPKTTVRRDWATTL